MLSGCQLPRSLPPTSRSGLERSKLVSVYPCSLAPHGQRQRMPRLAGSTVRREQTSLTRTNGIGIGRALSWGSEQLQDQLDRLLKEVETEDAIADSVHKKAVVSGLHCPTDLRESAHAYQCAIDLPGVAKGDIKIDVTGDRKLTICGERKPDLQTGWENKGQQRWSGEFQQEFMLADDADSSNISADLTLGVLTLTVKKKVPIASRSMSID